MDNFANEPLGIENRPEYEPPDIKTESLDDVLTMLRILQRDLDAPVEEMIANQQSLVERKRKRLHQASEFVRTCAKLSTQDPEDVYSEVGFGAAPGQEDFQLAIEQRESALRELKLALNRLENLERRRVQIRAWEAHYHKLR